MAPLTVATHLAARLNEHGVDCGFGIVGDYALRLFGRLAEAGVPVHVTGDEQGAAFAADAYARLRGLGFVAVTYGVGGFKVANAVAGAWAEQVPLLVVSGAAGMSERAGDPMLHHKVKDFDTQLNVFAEMTVAQRVLDDPRTAADDIDEVIAEVLAQQRPGYIEVPRDIVEMPIDPPSGRVHEHRPPVDEARMAVAVDDILEHLRAARRPVIQVGALAWRRAHGLGEPLREFAERTGIQVASSSLAKGVFPERHPLALGVYMGAVSSAEVVERVESADLLISLGVLDTDLTMGAFTAHREVENLVDCGDAEVSVGHRTYRDVPLWALLPALARACGDAGISFEAPEPLVHPHWEPSAEAPLSVARIITAVAAHVDDRHGLLVDPGECLFASVDLPAPHWCLASAYYATMGYAVPGSIGAGFADPAHRPVVLVGDGSFAMTGLEVATAAHYGVNPIVIVVDNGGYGTQRPMMDGPFNDVPPIASERLTEVIGAGNGWLATTEGELDAALAAAVASADLAIIRCTVPSGDRSPALQRLTDALGKRV